MAARHHFPLPEIPLRNAGGSVQDGTDALANCSDIESFPWKSRLYLLFAGILSGGTEMTWHDTHAPK